MEYIFDGLILYDIFKSYAVSSSHLPNKAITYHSQYVYNYMQ